MRTETRLAFNAYRDQLATLNEVPSAAEKFNVTPTVQQTLQTRMRESTAFLALINMVLVDEQSGEPLGMDVTHPVASTTDTSGGTKREPVDPTTLDKRGYTCTQTNFDTALRYDKLDMWAKFPDFQAKIRNAVIAQQARDMIMMGFNGTSRADTSNRTTNPLLQDVNVGWLQHMRNENAARVTSGVKVGDQADADFKNIDQAVMASIDAQLGDWWVEDPDLVVIAGRALLSDKYVALTGGHDAPTERNALETLMTNKQIGGKRAVVVPFFPANAFMVTRLDNLSTYEQRDKRRRHVKDEPEADRVADYQSTNLAYVVEDYTCALFSEGILTPDGVGGWQ